MPNQSTAQKNGHNTHTQPRRSSVALYGMLRKTKSRAFRLSNSRTSGGKELQSKLDNPNECTPNMDSGNDGLIQPLNSFCLGPQIRNNVRIGSRENWPTISHEHHSNYVEDVVAGVESSIRKLVICCGVFIAGTMMPEYAVQVQRLFELFLVAWGTCLTIVGLIWFQNLQQKRLVYIGNDGGFDGGVGEVDGVSDTRQMSIDQDFMLNRKTIDNEVEITTVKKKKTTPGRMSREPLAFMPPYLHQLEDLYIMLLGKHERLCPNGTAVKIETDLFVGEMLLMFRTSGADELPSLNSEDPICAHFRGKQRRFEWQWQIRFKKVPLGDLYVGCELDKPPAIGMIQRALVNTALKFVKKTNQGFGYYFSDSSDSPSYLSFPVGTSMDRFVATRSGEKVPQLGRELFEDPDAMRKRKRGGQIDWNTNDTYTMALWSAYFDWIDWKILNFPGIRPFSATSVAGIQPIKVNLYTISDTNAREVSSHIRQRNVLFALEISNATNAALGEEAKAWKSGQMNSMNTSIARVLNYDDEGIDDGNSEDDADIDDFESEIDIERRIGNLGSNEYVTSGTCLLLREGSGSFLASGGGYALLQSSSTSMIVLEKVFHSKKTFSYTQRSGVVPDPQLVIRNGDLVRVKLINISTNATKYLRIHRGWWLRWTSNRPTKTSSFHIVSNERPDTALSLRTPFSLRSRKWSNYQVGVCHESSAKYGGRMLAMLKVGKSTVDDEPAIECDEDDDIEDDDKDFVAEKPTNSTIASLLLFAELAKSSEAESPSSFKRSPDARVKESQHNELISRREPISTESILSQHTYVLDCPVWIEVMNRATRFTQLVYAVRVKENLSNHNTDTVLRECNHQRSGEAEAVALKNSDSEIQEYPGKMFMKLRSGKDIVPIINLGIRHKNDHSVSENSLAWQLTNMQLSDDGSDNNPTVDFDSNEQFQRTNSFSSSSDESDEDEIIGDDLTDFLIEGPDANVMSEPHTMTPKIMHEPSSSSEDDMRLSLDKNDEKRSNHSFHCSDHSLNALSSHEYLASTPKSLVVDDNDDPTNLDNEVEVAAALTGPLKEGKKKNKTKVLNRVAKTVKSSTVITGKQVIKQTKKVGKATVNTGLAAGRVLPKAYKPPKKHEPGSVFSSKMQSKPNPMKHIGRAIKNMESESYAGTHSGQLTTPYLIKEQISQILHQLSRNNSSDVVNVLSSFVKANSEQDLSFLRGSSAELGVIPLKDIDDEVDYDCICARGIWDGRWREECCVMYRKDSHLAFYAPLSRKPSLVVSFDEILSVRKCDPKPELNPLPGLPLVSIDSTWRCHYLAFLTEENREVFLRKINDFLYHSEPKKPTAETYRIAQEWESYKMSIETSLSGSDCKWSSVMIGKKSKQKRQRRIFNGRRMAFDLEPIVHNGSSRMEGIALFVEELLQKALSLTPESLESSESFLDDVSRLRYIPLHEIEYDSKEALCIFVNLYHCLLQHALLYAVDGLPDKRSATRFKRCSCYEIGDDVFSLAELECCVIRGKLSKAVNIKPPLVSAAKKSRSFLQYALDAADNRVNFYVNTGSLDHPNEVPVLRCKQLEHQIQRVSSSFLRNQVKINVKKRIVTIPKICDVYRNDFGLGDRLVCLSQLLRYLDESNQILIANLLENGGQITVRFRELSERFHPNLLQFDDKCQFTPEL